jgi:chromosome segregation ATPase
MERETLKEQNERLAKELKEARAQIQQLQQEVAKANEEIRLLNLERDTAVENMAYTQDEAHKDLIHYKMLAYELEAAHSDCRRLKCANKQLQEDKEVLQQKVEDLEHSVEERHKETTEAYKSMSEMLDKHEKELSKSQRKIWKLEDENKKFQERSENLKNPFGAGRKKNDAAYIKRYVEFSSLVRKGMSMEDIMGTMQISRSTYFRFLKVFKEDQEIDEREKSMKNNK